MFQLGDFRQPALPLLISLILYMAVVQTYRHRRKNAIAAPFVKDGRPLAEMTTKEAYGIISSLQELEFPSAFNKARKIALLKAGGIPTMSRLFAATGQNTVRNAGKRSVDTEIILRESQSQPRGSDRYAGAVARMNFLHDRYRKVNKITDDDLLHTLGDGLAEIFRVIGRDEWRHLTDVERCALGIFHRNLGDDMEIPFHRLPSYSCGWRDGLHFTTELIAWTHQYEEEVCQSTKTNDQYVRVYVDSAFRGLPPSILRFVRQMLADEVDGPMRASLGLEAPSFFVSSALAIIRHLRIFVLRYLCLPRSRPIKLVNSNPNPATNLYNFPQMSLQPWYVKPTFWNKWGPLAWLIRTVGGKVPGAQGQRFHPQGYDLFTIGPDPARGKGIEDMTTSIATIKSKGVATCPFSRAKEGSFVH